MSKYWKPDPNPRDKAPTLSTSIEQLTYDDRGRAWARLVEVVTDPVELANGISDLTDEEIEELNDWASEYHDACVLLAEFPQIAALPGYHDLVCGTIEDCQYPDWDTLNRLREEFLALDSEERGSLDSEDEEEEDDD